MGGGGEASYSAHGIPELHSEEAVLCETPCATPTLLPILRKTFRI